MLFSLKLLSCSCRHERVHEHFLNPKKEYSVKKIAHLPLVVNESSGIVFDEKSKSFWTLNDSGGEEKLYEVSLEDGRLVSEKKIEGTKNIDWEDLTKDNKGNFYIGDFGNNANNRKNLRIYQVRSDGVKEIRFRYRSQKFDSNDERIYDCEAFFWMNEKLYLFSKDWSKKNVTYLYELPANPGEYVLESKSKIYLKAQITSAAVSPDNKEFALLAYGKLFFFGIENGEVDFSIPKYCMKLAKKQAEGLTYLDENTLLLTNEQGDVYKIKKSL